MKLSPETSLTPDFSLGILSACFSLVALAAATGCSRPAEPKLPNYVIFLADDLGYGDLACYGNPVISTPNLDRFASQGVVLTDCHSAGTVCSPSRAALLTGRNPYRSGFSYIAGGKSFLRDSEVTIAELLKQKGYQTGFFGKWHLSNLADTTKADPGEQGFDYWLATSVNAFEGPENPLRFIRNGKAEGKMTGWYCDILVRESLEWLDRIDPKKPFLLVICTHEPHTPVAPPDSLAAPYRDASLLTQIGKIRYGGVDRENKFELNRAADYYGTVTQLDNAFGSFVSGIDRMDGRENTLVFFTSDNGPEHPVNLEESRGEWSDSGRDQCYGTPGVFRGMKRYVYEGGHRVPGIARWPGMIPGGTVSAELFNGSDLFPVISRLSGLQVPGSLTLDGEPAFEAFLGKPVKREKPVLWIFPTHEDTWYRMPHLSLRDGALSLIGWFPPKAKDDKLIPWMERSVPERFELYDIVKDPGQTRNIADSLPDATSRLTGEMTSRWLGIRMDYMNLMNHN
jgi:arylsulfatase A-like enzyme